MQIVGARIVEDDRVTTWGTTEGMEPDVAFEVAPLRAGWGNTGPGQFESGAGPIEALGAARRSVAAGADVVIIRCVDHLRTGYGREERAELMRIFGDVSVPEAYTSLAREWCLRHDVRRSEFERVARALEANYRRTVEERGLKVDPPGAHDVLVTDWFRRVDCANPNIDFECELWCRSDRTSHDGVNTAKVHSCGTIEVPGGPENIDSLAEYKHLAAIISRASAEADITIETLWESGALELYTCFPIVPLAFLYASGLATSIDETLERIESRPLTLSGGMTLARAPWNGPALRGLALAAARVATDGCTALVHGNGGLGGKQGIAILGRVDGGMNPIE